MVSILFNKDRRVEFSKDTHTYTIAGNPLQSVTRLLSSVMIPFESQKISYAMAKGDPGRQKEILEQWEEKRVSAENRGNWIHDNIESFVKFGNYDEKLQSVVSQMKPVLKEGYRFYSEAMVYSTEHMVAGQTDLVVQRQKSLNSVFDFYDLKTNEAKGIQFDSIYRKKDPHRHYNKFLLPPLDHLEDCNYNIYSLQLSMYAHLAQETWGIKIGKLAILFIDNDLQLHQYPVPYMKMEVKKLLDSRKNLKSIPATTDDDDWV